MIEPQLHSATCCMSVMHIFFFFIPAWKLGRRRVVRLTDDESRLDIAGSCRRKKGSEPFSYMPHCATSCLSIRNPSNAPFTGGKRCLTEQTDGGADISSSVCGALFPGEANG